MRLPRPIDPDNWLVAFYILIFSAMVVALLAPAMIAFAQGDETMLRILGDEGYTEIQSTGYRFLACSENDVFRQGFTAKSPAGKPVSGTLCGNWLKGHTIRFD